MHPSCQSKIINNINMLYKILHSPRQSWPGNTRQDDAEGAIQWLVNYPVNMVNIGQ